MSKFNMGEKAPEKEAIKALSLLVVGIYDGTFAIKKETDDGGGHLNLYLEVDNTSKSLDPLLHDVLWHAKWQGWRYMITKCPKGYIEAIINAEPRDY
jgi:hypothetical protein